MMPSKKFIEDATPENFADLVIGIYMRWPVPVNFRSATALNMIGHDAVLTKAYRQKMMDALNR